MIVGLGLDVVEVARVAQALARHGERFLSRCFLPGELTRPHDPEHVAGLFAAKEAAFKALGTGWGEGVGWHDVVVERDAEGKPNLTFHGPAQERMQTLGAQRVLVSITHTDHWAAAVVILSL